MSDFPTNILAGFSWEILASACYKNYPQGTLTFAFRSYFTPHSLCVCERDASVTIYCVHFALTKSSDANLHPMACSHFFESSHPSVDWGFLSSTRSGLGPGSEENTVI